MRQQIIEITTEIISHFILGLIIGIGLCIPISVVLFIFWVITRDIEN